MEYIIVHNETNNIINIILWDGEAPYQPKAGTTMFKKPDDVPVGFGWKKTDSGWEAPPEPEEPTEP